MIEKFIEQYYNDFIPYKTKSWCYEDGILLKATLDLYLSGTDCKTIIIILFREVNDMLENICS